MTRTTSKDALTREVQVWIDATWRNDLSVREWWRLLFEAGYSYPAWPAGMGGRGASAAEARSVHAVLAANRLVGPPIGHVAAGLAAPTILEHGTPEQIAELVPPIALGEVAWCQLFSEPGSGSDLASIGAKAVRDGDEWVVSGQKVWNSGADHSHFGMLLVRTDVEQPKHRGLTYLLIDMTQDGVETRPLRQMNGESNFCEVFLDEARVPATRMLGQLDGGWAVAQTTLFHERNSIAGGGFDGLTQGRSGETAGDLDITVGELIARSRAAAATSTITSRAIRGPLMIELARATRSPLTRSSGSVSRLITAKSRSTAGSTGGSAPRGKLTGADGSLSKMTTSRICQVSRDLSYSIIGAHALLAGTDSPMGGDIQRVGLSSPGTRIGGGTDEIQLNVIGERGLGLPREPESDRDVPYRDLRVGTQR